MVTDNFLKLTEADEARRLEASMEVFHVLFKREDVSIELFAPLGTDTQSPHAQDEIYIVSNGRSKFLRNDEIVTVCAGDALFVPAGVTHRFFEFSDDFRTWVIFFGPEAGSRPDMTLERALTAPSDQIAV